ncbi:glycoside hydrolase family 16 protein [Hydnum rufescens UP504]|uniref:Glycoside hydrolase family 16 protein n=1 Tax=Hydnum rufescens UP504 TaxID=1448309 RepID=A0A9P6B384_9AGAM|nr:glycoside hydrolase family 16 protein [Hydnum rufescens UP504]
MTGSSLPVLMALRQGMYQSRSAAFSQNLAYINSVGNAVIKVDNKTVGLNAAYGRASVRISSKTTVKEGSLILMEARHVPYGCSVWPAFWTQGTNWPSNGEIDIFEGVNVVTSNTYTLHTLNGCIHPGNSSAETGIVTTTDCFNATNGNSGCSVREMTDKSYGEGFACIGGGAFATLWNTAGISTWFFPNGSIPSDFYGSSPNPASWGTPSAYWPSTSCNTTKFFGPQTMIFDITLCGNYAGATSVFDQTCYGVCTDLIMTPTHYDNAYFEIVSVRTYSDGSDTAKTGAALGGASRMFVEVWKTIGIPLASILLVFILA